MGFHQMRQTVGLHRLSNPKFSKEGTKSVKSFDKIGKLMQSLI